MTAKLFTPLTIRGVTLPNRVVLAPLCQYSAKEGVAQDWHFAHLSTFARGGVGLVFTEATAVEARGRITHGCLGIWTDEQAEALKPVVKFISDMGAVPGMQIAHAGRKASARRPWQGGVALNDEDAAKGEAPWRTVGPTNTPVGPNWHSPDAMTEADIATVRDAFVVAAKRALAVGFKVMEIHAAHGYLIHSFLTPLVNTRNDAYGGDLAGRMRFALEVAAAVRAVWPEDLPLFMRISAIDGPEDGWSLDDSVVLARELGKLGIDVVDCSSGGHAGAPRFRAADDGKPLPSSTARGPGFQVPFAERLKREADVMTMAVGIIVDPQQAENILQQERADLVALGRELMFNPFWALHAARALEADPETGMWPEQYRWAVMRWNQLSEYREAAARGETS